MCLESTRLLEKVKGKSIILLVEKDGNILGDKKEAVVTTPFSEKKLFTNDVDKGTDELEDMKEEVVTIRRKD